jgi:hypothetical protein
VRLTARAACDATGGPRGRRFNKTLGPAFRWRRPQSQDLERADAKVATLEIASTGTTDSLAAVHRPLFVSDHVTADFNIVGHRHDNARIIVCNTCSAFLERKHFIGTSDRDSYMRQLS